MSYWWIVDYITKDNGKIQPTLIGNRAFLREADAQKFLDGVNATQRVEIIELPTRNPSKASQFIRGKLVKDTKDTSAALTRVKHQKSRNVIEEEVSRPRFKRVGRGLLEGGKRRAGSGDEPKSERHYAIR